MTIERPFRTSRVHAVFIAGLWHRIAKDASGQSTFRFEPYQMETADAGRQRPVIGDPGRYAYRFTSGEYEYFGPATAIQAYQAEAE